MKKFLLIAIAIVGITFAFVGCKQQSEEEKMKAAFEEALTKAEQSQQTETELFLGFRFGMNEKQFESFLDSLENVGKVYTDKLYAYKYNFNLSADLNLQVGFRPMFDNDSLYAITYSLGSEYSLGNEMEMMMMSFNQSERRKAFRGYYVDDIIGNTSYHYIKDNLMITFRKNGIYSYMDYENVPIANRVKREKEEHDENVREQSKLEF